MPVSNISGGLDASLTFFGWQAGGLGAEYMNPFALPPFLAACLNASLLAWIYQAADRGPVRRTFLIWNSYLCLWNLGVGIGYLMPDALSAYQWYKLVSSLVISFIAPAFLHFVVIITDLSTPTMRKKVIAGYGVGLLLSLCGLLTPLLMRDVHAYFWGYYPLAGRGEWLFGGSFSLMVIYACTLLVAACRRSSGYQRNQLQYLLLGVLICFGAGLTNFLPLYGISVYPVGNLLNSLYSLLVAYAIVEYGLMDIRIVLRRGVAYSLLSGALTVVYLSIVAVFKRIFGVYGIEEASLYYMAAVPVTALLAPPMKARIEPWVDRGSFWKKYPSPDTFREFAQSVLTVFDLPAAAERILQYMCSIIGAPSGAIYLRSSTEQAFLSVHSRGVAGPSRLEKDHAVIGHLAHDRSEFMKEKALWPCGDEGARRHAALAFALKDWPYALAIPLFVDQRLIGLIAFGEKVSGDMFNQEDAQLLRALAVPATVALHNARAIADLECQKQSLKRNQEMALIGMLTTEMAHELAKPLTRILNAESRLHKALRGPHRENLERIEKETLRASEILESFTMLSPHLRLQRTPVPVAELIDEALDVLGIREDAGIEIAREIDVSASAFVQRGQIVQVLTNLIQNAWQAMPEGGTLTLSVRTLAHVVEIGILDTGAGIAPEIRERVFEPFFTTRQRLGGRGVGLTLSRAMVERHGGALRLESPATGPGGPAPLSICR